MIGDPPLLVVDCRFRRPTSDLLARFDGVQTGVVADAQGGGGAIDFRIKPLTEATEFAGPALTVAAGPSDVFAPFVALKFARPGDVLVIATGACHGTAVIGDLFVGMALNCGIRAIVTDGLVRDVIGFEALGVPVFALGLSPNSPYRRGPGRIGTSVVIGGIAVASGDILVGDRNGVVVVPSGRAQSVATEIPRVLKQERTREDAVRNGMRIPDWVDDVIASGRVTLIEGA